jgi:hypothetical protein
MQNGMYDAQYLMDAPIEIRLTNWSDDTSLAISYATSQSCRKRLRYTGESASQRTKLEADARECEDAKADEYETPRQPLCLLCRHCCWRFHLVNRTPLMPFIDIEGDIPTGLDSFTTYQAYNVLDSAVTAQLLPIIQAKYNDNHWMTYRREQRVWHSASK